MPKFPVEIYGHHWQAKNAAAQRDRQQYRCPFMKERCDKKSRLVRTPFGVCSAEVGGEAIALCPNRFLEGERVFNEIAEHHFHTTTNLLRFNEVGLKRVGRFDYVLVRHKPVSDQIEDFVMVEFQGGQTTSTGKLVQGFKDFLKGVPVGERNYGFEINKADIWKRTFTQILNKGNVLEHWGHRIYWVVQERIFQDLVSRYNLQGLGYSPKHSTVFALYDLVPDGKAYRLTHKRFVSASVDDLFRAFRTNPNIPSKQDFMDRLSAKISAQLKLGLQVRRSR